MNWKRVMATVAVSVLVFSGCATSGGQDQGNVKQMTIGTVQSEIKMGMSAAQVAEALGSPNIVTTDEKRREVWIYDKVSSNRVDTSSSAYGTLIILGGSTRSGSSTSTQKTMTIIIKFDENKMVRDFAYNFTQF
ncbi:outer membrane protein assembly factor BamE domain-containing protein [Nitrospina sp. 32_T5]|uniref:outer membrane protein assembly factor BamE domain-containing protein n=1 Tax=unclassified Nitrospina TaxID=2638683 RepID=UPI003F950E8F